MRRLGLIVIPILVALTATGCASASVGRSSTPSPTVASATRAPIAVQPTQPVNDTLTFYNQGGNVDVIDVYPGPGRTFADKVSDGTFFVGQTAQIVCKTTGRPIEFIITAKKVISTMWYYITAGGQYYYASAVYAVVGRGSPIPTCS
jgi:hypothetical protein